MIAWPEIGAFVAVITVVQGLHIAVTRAVVRQEIATLNGTYRRTEVCDATMAPITASVHSLGAKVDGLTDYIHESKRELENELAGVKIQIAADKVRDHQ
jgi:hypothetical protein